MSKLFTGFHKTTRYGDEVLHFEEIFGQLGIWAETNDEAAEGFMLDVHPEEIPDIIKVLKKAYKRYKEEFING